MDFIWEKLPIRTLLVCVSIFFMAVVFIFLLQSYVFSLSYNNGLKVRTRLSNVVETVVAYGQKSDGFTDEAEFNEVLEEALKNNQFKEPKGYKPSNIGIQYKTFNLLVTDENGQKVNIPTQPWQRGTMFCVQVDVEVGIYKMGIRNKEGNSQVIKFKSKRLCGVTAPYRKKVTDGKFDSFKNEENR